MVETKPLTTIQMTKTCTVVEEAVKFVRETHQAVHDFDKWNPEDKQGKAIIKKFVETTCSKPPLLKIIRT